MPQSMAGLPAAAGILIAWIIATRLAEYWRQAGTLGLLQQLGALPPP